MRSTAVTPWAEATWASASHNVDAMPGEGTLQLAADFLVLIGNQAGQKLHHGDLSSIHLVEVGELHTDSAASHNHHRARQVFQDNGLPTGNYSVLVNRKGGNTPGTGASGDDDVLSVELLAFWGYFNHAVAAEPARPSNVVYLVLPHQVGHTPHVAVNRFPAAVNGY